MLTEANDWDMTTSEPARQNGRMIVGTRLETTFGIRPVDAIIPGDEVLTFDAGPQKVIGKERGKLWKGEGQLPESLCPIYVPQGTCGNEKPMHLLPDQGVMMESDTAEELIGDPFALIPALALLGVPGVRRYRPKQKVWCIALLFESDQVVMAEGGALLHCHAAGSLTGVPFGPASADMGYSMLSYRAARRLLRGMGLVSEQEKPKHNNLLRAPALRSFSFSF